MLVRADEVNAKFAQRSSARMAKCLDGLLLLLEQTLLIGRRRVGSKVTGSGQRVVVGKVGRTGGKRGAGLGTTSVSQHAT